LEQTTYDDVVKYYQNSTVREEISAFCRGRWVAVHCEKKTPQGVPYLVRYKGWKRKVPLAIRDEADVTKLLNLFSKLSPRTFYGTINQYKKLENQEDMDDEDNIERTTPIWDIDNTINEWETTIKAAKLIVEFLKDNGIKKSIFVKWSGNGAHVHLNSSAFSDEAYKRIGSLNVAFATVQFVIKSLTKALRDLVESAKSRYLAVENKIDPKRIFTAPLSFHRSLFRSCVCVLPEDLERFDISWTNPHSFRHDGNWNRSTLGEADSLGELAFSKIGPCPYTGRLHRGKPTYLSVNESKDRREQ
jgi:hypothetical protein